MEFGKKLKEVREKLGISQEMMARELGVSFATINRLENGKTEPSYKTLKLFENLCKNKNIMVGEQDEK